MSDTADAPEAIRPPRMIVLAFAVAIAHVVLSVLNSAMLWGFQGYLRQQLVDSNAKAKKPKANYDLSPANIHNVNHDLHSGLNVGLIQIIVFGLLVILLAYNFRKGKGWARWAEVLVLIIVVQAPFRLLNLGGNSPILMRTVSALVGLTGVAVIILLFVPESSKYFTAVRGATARDRSGTGTPTGFRGLFGPRPRPSAEPGATLATRGAKQPVRATAKPSEKASANASAKAPTQAEQGAKAAGASVPPDAVAADRRPKAKARAGVDAGAPAQSGGSTPAKAPAPAAKSRGKSRRSS